MKILGLIVEYNPFTQGHKHHLDSAKKLVNPDLTIAIMSGNFVQRGEPAIINKWKRANLALEMGVDLVIELPFVFVVQSADYFASGAIQLLHHLGCTDLVFGSESNNSKLLIEIASTLKDNQQLYDEKIKQFMKEGFRYPDACNQAISAIMQRSIKTPNDILGLAYVKEIINNNYPIKIHTIQRSNDFHSVTMSNDASASAIRHALKHNQPLSDYVINKELFNDELHFLNDFFAYLKYMIIITPSNILHGYHLVEEGLENKLKKEINNCDNVDQLIDQLTSKRYTQSRIRRMLLHILLQDTKEDINNCLTVDYIRVLKMNNVGQAYLSKIKKELSIPLIVNLSSNLPPALDIEIKATKLLNLTSNEDLLKQEFTNIPISK